MEPSLLLLASVANTVKKSYYMAACMYDAIKNKIAKAPQTPGVYFFRNARGRVIYVGKAVNLRSRLKSYSRGDWKTEMLREAKSVTWEELGSDIEALISEAGLIKKLKPRYNIWMRDDKNYFFVALTKDKFPRIYLTHQPAEVRFPRGSRTSPRGNRASFIGPFTDGNALKETLRLLRRIFPYCTCLMQTRHKRKCVNAEIGKCLGFCCAHIPARAGDIARYKSNITAIKKVLSGKTKALERALQKKMLAEAKSRRYEQARILRDQIAGLKRIFEHRNFIQRDKNSESLRALATLAEILGTKKQVNRIECFDISHHAGSAPVASMAVFENGHPVKSEYRKFIIRRVSGINDPAMIQEAIARRLTHSPPAGGWQSPDMILVDGGKPQLNAAKNVLKTSDVHWTSDVLLAAVAKREEELYVVGKKEPHKLKNLPPPLLHLITSIRDEAHQFAVSFHRKRRSRLVLKT